MSKKPISRTKKTTSKKKTNIDSKPLLFVDTNIFLDCYRTRSHVTLDLINRLDKIKGDLIISEQVEMEFKKNRQACIKKAMDSIPVPGKFNDVPGFLVKSKNKEMIERAQSDVIERIRKLKAGVNAILSDPSQRDPVYQMVQRLFTHDSELNLRRPKEERQEIRDLAQKRWLLGYPPRKEKDTSIGDAINWEWIVRCSQVTKKDVIIVSRDGDFGSEAGKDTYINDWLREEFKARTSLQRQVVLTKSLAHALTKADLTVDKGIVDAEKVEIEQVDREPIIVDVQLPEVLKRQQEELESKMKRFLDLIGNPHNLPNFFPSEKK